MPRTRECDVVEVISEAAWHAGRTAGYFEALDREEGLEREWTGWRDAPAVRRLVEGSAVGYDTAHWFAIFNGRADHATPGTEPDKVTALLYQAGRAAIEDMCNAGGIASSDLTLAEWATGLTAYWDGFLIGALHVGLAMGKGLQWDPHVDDFDGVKVAEAYRGLHAVLPMRLLSPLARPVVEMRAGEFAATALFCRWRDLEGRRRNATRMMELGATLAFALRQTMLER